MKAVQARTRIALKNILFATDFSPAANAAVPFATQIARRYGAKVYGVQETMLHELLPKEAELWCEPTCLVEQGHAAAEILAVAERRHADLIVLGARPAKGLLGAWTRLNGGTVHKVVSQAKCPVITVHGRG
ncbi:MAG TPA: universal stress protein [Candidatus Dormibacteraeota bacterium]|nr:universal stress protein [Candidatus Dormibacteraeota bacterium]